MSIRSRGSDRFDLPLLLDALAGVDYIIVGGVAGTLHGSPRVTFDLDIVPDRAETNVEQLDVALTRLGASIRAPGKRRLTVSLQLLKESAASSRDLDRVVELCKSALDKGLADSSKKLAENLMKSTLQDQIKQLMVRIEGGDGRWRFLRREALNRLDRLIDACRDRTLAFRSTMDTKPQQLAAAALLVTVLEMARLLEGAVVEMDRVGQSLEAFRSAMRELLATEPEEAEETEEPTTS